MKKAGKIIGKILSTILLVCIVFAAVVIAGPRMIGWQPLVVLSGSMEPAYPVGSLVYVKKAEPAEVKTNDVITFYMEDGQTVVTHRVVKIDTNNQCFFTKGDANDTQDGGTTPYSRLIGKPVFFIPKMGYVTSYVNTGQGLILVATVLVCLLILAILPDLLMKKVKKDEPQMESQSKGG